MSRKKQTSSAPKSRSHHRFPALDAETHGGSGRNGYPASGLPGGAIAARRSFSVRAVIADSVIAA
jgi:hypothetical protein